MCWFAASICFIWLWIDRSWIVNCWPDKLSHFKMSPWALFTYDGQFFKIFFFFLLKNIDISPPLKETDIQRVVWPSAHWVMSNTSIYLKHQSDMCRSTDTWILGPKLISISRQISINISWETHILGDDQSNVVIKHLWQRQDIQVNNNLITVFFFIYRAIFTVHRYKDILVLYWHQYIGIIGR